MIFLNSLFGYLSLLIIVKWCTGSQADLYHVMIYMFLSPTDDLGENQLFVGQKFLQVFFFLFFSLSIKYWLCRNFPMLHKTKTLILNTSIFSLPASVTTISPCCCTMDAVSKAFFLEETKWRSMLKTSIHVVSYYYFYRRSFCFIFSACFDLLSSMSCFVRGTKVNPMHYFTTALMTLLKWNLIMIPMVMRNLSSVRSLYTNLYIP